MNLNLKQPRRKDGKIYLSIEKGYRDSVTGKPKNKTIQSIQKKVGRLYSAEKIVDCLKRISCSNEHENVYLFDYRSEVSDAIGKALGIDFTNKRLRLGGIKIFG